jgi:hypothetical protein
VQVVIAGSAAEVGRLAASKISHLVRRQPHAVLGLATGSSPLAIYAELARQVREEGLDCSAVRPPAARALFHRAIATAGTAPTGGGHRHNPGCSTN